MAVGERCDPWDELAELDALSERLRLKHYDLKRNINQFHSPIVRQLPPDVTSTIFEFCLPNFADHQLSFYTKEDLSIPLSLGAICSYWREIAWSTPSLWSSLVVRVPSKKRFTYDHWHTVAHKTVPMFCCFGQMNLVRGDDVIQNFETYVQ
jgi:hypothetical protein